MLLEGLHIPITTPFHADGRLHPHKLASNVARYSRTPASGLIVLSPFAEPTLLSDDETREVLRTVAAAAAPEKVLLAGIARDSVHATLVLADFAAEENYDALLLAPPSITISPREVSTYFRTIADRAPLPIVLAGGLSADIIAELAAHPSILGLLTSQPAEFITTILARTSSVRREVIVTPSFAAVTERMQLATAHSAGSPVLISAGSLIDAAAAAPEPIAMTPPLRTRTRTVGFQLLAAHTPSLLAAIQAGAKGLAPAFAAAAPQACYEIFAAWKDGDEPLASEKQQRLIEAAQLAESSPGLLQFACDLNGYAGGLPRLPHLPPTETQRTALEQLMKPLRN